MEKNKINKTSQSGANQGTLSDLSAIQQKIVDLAAKGIQVPDAVKLMQDPNAQLIELEKIQDQSNIVSDAAENVDQMASKVRDQHLMNMEQMKDIQNSMPKAAQSFNEVKTDASALKDAIFNSVEDFVTQYLDINKEINVRNEILDVTSPAGDEKVIGHISRYYKITGDNPNMTLFEKSKLANPIYEHLPASMKGNSPETGVVPDAEFKGYKEIESFVNDVNENIKKIAQSHVINKTKTFNLHKQAQAKTTENIIMYGPSEKRFDPFLRQPISDWHIVERNKGYGFVVDDIWNIDWEAIWRGNIMDKYSRPYRDNKTGEWIGGYIEKRFEVDKWIPEGNNYQLKPGELRRPYNPERGSTEARLEAMRAKEADKRGYKPQSEGKPYDWNDKKEYSETKVASFNLSKKKR